MPVPALDRNRAFLLAAGLVAALWGAAGLRTLDTVPYLGYWTDINHTVRRVFRHSPAEAAGLRKGDVIRSIAGIPAEDTGALLRRPRPRIGDACPLEVERDGETLALNAVYAPLPGTERGLLRASYTIGFAFLILGLLCELRFGDRPSRLFAVVGVTLGLAFFDGPYGLPYAVRMLAGIVHEVAVILGLAVFLHLMLTFPRPKRILRRPAVTRLLYAPAGLVGLFVIFLYVVQPQGTGALNAFTSALFGLFVAAYFGLSLFAMLHSYRNTPPAERTRQGLTLMLWGLVVGLAPVLVVNLVRAAAPTYMLPGVEYYFLTLAAVPLSLTAALWMLHRPSRAAPAE